MPNDVSNEIAFDCSEERFQEILESIRLDGEHLGTFDFNKLIPMPESLNIESGSRGSQGCKLYKDFLTVLLQLLAYKLQGQHQQYFFEC